MAGAGGKVRRLTVSAVFLSIALVFKYFSFDIPLFGVAGVRVGFAEVFHAIPALLFGPVYGAVTAALADGLGFALKPTGPYMPLITLTAALGGFLRGALWRFVLKINTKRATAILSGISAAILLFGVYNLYCFGSDGITPSFYDFAPPAEEIETGDMSRISALIIRGTATRGNPAAMLSLYINVLTRGLLIFGAVALILINAGSISVFVRRARKERNPSVNPKPDSFNTVQVFIVIILAGLTVNTLNTIILREMVFQSWQLLPFVAVWLPRAVEELLTCVFGSYIIAVLYGIMQRRGFNH